MVRMNKMDREDYKELLVKYCCHICASEGEEFAFDVDLSPCAMGSLEFSDHEKHILNTEIFTEARTRYHQP